MQLQSPMEILLFLPKIAKTVFSNNNSSAMGVTEMSIPW